MAPGFGAHVLGDAKGAPGPPCLARRFVLFTVLGFHGHGTSDTLAFSFELLKVVANVVPQPGPAVGIGAVGAGILE